MTPEQKDRLAHALKLRYGTAPSEPTDSQIDLICAYIERVGRQRQPTDRDWAEAVNRYCPTAGTHKYGAIDNSDLNALLKQGIQQMRGK